MKIFEIFRSIQGESYLAGRPCTFVRTAGCNLNCTWCDTRYAADPADGEEMTVGEVMQKVTEFGADLVEVTGGEPLLQEESVELMRLLCDTGARVMLETNGTLDITPVDPRVIVVMDIKAPSSGHADTNRWANLEVIQDSDELKVVISDREDYEWAKKTLAERGIIGNYRVSFSPVFGTIDYKTLAEWLLADRLPVRMGFQLHKMIWGPDAKGV